MTANRPAQFVPYEKAFGQASEQALQIFADHSSRKSPRISSHRLNMHSCCSTCNTDVRHINHTYLLLWWKITYCLSKNSPAKLRPGVRSSDCCRATISPTSKFPNLSAALCTDCNARCSGSAPASKTSQTTKLLSNLLLDKGLSVARKGFQRSQHWAACNLQILSSLQA